MDLSPVRGSESDHAIAALKEEAHVEMRQEPAAGLLRTLQQQVVERAPIANKGDVLAARDDEIMQPRCHEPQTIDRIGLACDRLVHAACLEQLAALGRHRAAARLVARKIESIDDDHALHAKLAEVDGRRQARRSGTDDADIGTNGRSFGVPQRLRFAHSTLRDGTETLT
jgi:hypothetical protein